MADPETPRGGGGGGGGGGVNSLITLQQINNLPTENSVGNINNSVSN